MTTEQQVKLAYQFLKRSFGNPINGFRELKIDPKSQQASGIFRSGTDLYKFQIASSGKHSYRAVEQVISENGDSSWEPKAANRVDDAKPICQVVEFLGMKIGIQYRAGDERHGRRLPFAYGHIRGTRGADGMAIDCYLGPKLDSQHMYEVRQLHHETGEFDEEKVMLGFNSAEEAERAFKKVMPARMYGGIKTIGIFDLYRNDAYDATVSREAPSMFSDVQRQKIGFVMSEYAANRLRNPNGEIVTDPKEAKAIALFEAGIQADDMGLPSGLGNMKVDAYEDLNDEQRYEFDDTMQALQIDGPYDKIDVGYTHPAPDAHLGIRCFNCAYKATDSPENGPMACVLVEGQILADGICTEALIPPRFVSDGEPGVQDKYNADAGKACGESFIPEDHECHEGENEEGESSSQQPQKQQRKPSKEEQSFLDKIPTPLKIAGLALVGIVGAKMAANVMLKFVDSGIAQDIFKVGVNPRDVSLIQNDFRYEASPNAPTRKKARKVFTKMAGGKKGFEQFSAQKKSKLEQRFGTKVSSQGAELLKDAPFYGRRNQALDLMAYNRAIDYNVEADRAARDYLIDRGDLAGELGKGRYGTVFETKQNTALKVGVIGDDIELSVMMGELGVGPKVVDFDVIPDSRAQYLEMEKLDLTPLANKSGGLQPGVNKEDIATAIAKMHRSGVGHRDLHLNNLGTDANGNVRVWDFGASEMLEDQELVDQAIMDLFQVSGGSLDRETFKTGRGENTPIADKAHDIMTRFRAATAQGMPDWKFLSLGRELGQEWIDFVNQQPGLSGRTDAGVACGESFIPEGNTCHVGEKGKQSRQSKQSGLLAGEGKSIAVGTVLVLASVLGTAMLEQSMKGAAAEQFAKTFKDELKLPNAARAIAATPQISAPQLPGPAGTPVFEGASGTLPFEGTPQISQIIQTQAPTVKFEQNSFLHIHPKNTPNRAEARAAFDEFQGGSQFAEMSNKAVTEHLEKKFNASVSAGGRELLRDAPFYGRRGKALDIKAFNNAGGYDYLTDKPAVEWITQNKGPLEELGRGKYGFVGKTQNGTAIKVGAITDDMSLSVMMGEAGIGPKVLDFDVVPDSRAQYMEMETIDGFNSLWDNERGARAPRSQYSPEDFAGKLAQMHKAGIVHRDLHLNNVGTDANGEIKIIDFGSAQRDHPLHNELAMLDVYRASGGAKNRKVFQTSPRQNTPFADKAHELSSRLRRPDWNAELTPEQNRLSVPERRRLVTQKLGNEWIDFINSMR